jgi:hypothetical protein
MCGNCMDDSTDNLMENTGIHPQTMQLIDGLCIAALNLGKTETTFNGDPLFNDKLSLCVYIAALEQAVMAAAQQLGMTPAQLGVDVGVLKQIPLHALGVRDTNIH